MTRTDRVSRVITAPAERIYATMTDPDDHAAGLASSLANLAAYVER